MSAIFVMPVIIPAVTSAMPLLAAAATAAATSLGYAAVSNRQQTETDEITTVDVPVEHAAPLVQGLNRGEALVFSNGESRLEIRRNATGNVMVQVSGAGKSEAELATIGREMAGLLVRQYAYHQLVTELNRREFAIVGEETETDGSIRLRVRAFR